ncbi:MAG: E1 ubiquitin-activating protein uba2 [Sclerophora amabilis]|nr:MAG: E1 ubiquitin-activating protein uba2 [Sclerophora amabilis]
MVRDRYLHQSLGGNLYGAVRQSRILMVGAGGIGCELLKNLVLTGFGEIHIVDLDTVDLSNLNRQFLFRHEHIKKSKAIVAKDAAGRFNPDVKLEAHHANIKDPVFNIDWFQGFQLVFNALDNLEARRHVNKMCLAANVPLIESGTTGFNGQVQVIVKVRQVPKETRIMLNVLRENRNVTIVTSRKLQKAFPSAPFGVLRANQSIVLSGRKATYSRGISITQDEIFGTSEDDVPELDTTEDSENAKEIENLRKEAQALKRIRQSMGSTDFPREVFQKVFHEDIQRLRSMEGMWRTRKPPEVLDFEQITEKASAILPLISTKDQAPWTLEENYAVFADSLRRLSGRLQEAQAKTAPEGPPAILSFDKDDNDTLDFVAASANLRAHIFGIEVRSKFDIKQMAGNIIPAIATTNAMVASLCVLQAYKVLRERLDTARMVFLTKSTDRVLSAEPLRPPNPDCPSCGVAQIRLEVDTSRATLDDLVGGFLRPKLGYGEEFSVNNDIGTLYDPELDDNLNKRFSDLGIKSDSFLTVIDEDDESPRVNLVLAISEKSISEDSKPLVAPEQIEVPRRPKPVEKPKTMANGQSNGVPEPNGTSGKRKRDAEDTDELGEQIKKRGKVIEDSTSSKDTAAIILDNVPSNGAIMIDDD